MLCAHSMEPRRDIAYVYTLNKAWCISVHYVTQRLVRKRWPLQFLVCSKMCAFCAKSMGEPLRNNGHACSADWHGPPKHHDRVWPWDLMSWTWCMANMILKLNMSWTYAKETMCYANFLRKRTWWKWLYMWHWLMMLRLCPCLPGNPECWPHVVEELVFI